MDSQARVDPCLPRMPRVMGHRAGRRTVTLALAGAALMPGALAACVQGGPTSPAGSSAPAVGAVTWMHNANPATSGFDKVAEAFRTKYPNVKLDVQQQTDQYDDKLLAAYSAGSPPDVLRLNDDFVLPYKTKNLLAPLDGYVKSSGLKRDDFQPAVFDFPVHDGKRWCWFLGANCRMLFYNVDLFKKMGVALPPTKWDTKGWTFDDFLETAKRLTNANASPAAYGCSIYDDSGYEQTLSINNGSPTGIFSKDGRSFTLADPPGYDAMQWLADLALKQRVHPTRQVIADNKNVATMLANQQIGMRWTNTGNLQQMQRDNAFTWDVAPIPMRVKRMQEGAIQTYALAVGAKNPDNGWRLLNFFTDEDAARIFIGTGFVIPAKKAFSKDFVAAHAGKSPANTALILESFNFQMQTNQTLDTPAARRIYRGDGNSNLNMIWDGKVTAKDWLTSVRGQVEAAIAPK